MKGMAVSEDCHVVTLQGGWTNPMLSNIIEPWLVRPTPTGAMPMSTGVHQPDSLCLSSLDVRWFARRHLRLLHFLIAASAGTLCPDVSWAEQDTALLKVDYRRSLTNVKLILKATACFHQENTSLDSEWQWKLSYKYRVSIDSYQVIKCKKICFRGRWNICGAMQFESIWIHLANQMKRWTKICVLMRQPVLWPWLLLFIGLSLLHLIL